MTIHVSDKFRPLGRVIEVDRHRSKNAAKQARAIIPGGAASAARWRNKTTPIFAACADGATITDIDKRTYLDFVLGLGPVILGHRPPEVLDAVASALESGIVYATPHEREADLAERVIAAVPSAERVTFTCTGSEAVHLAVRTARSQTGRSRIVKFDGHYHGWLDPLFVNAPGGTSMEGAVNAPTHAVSGQVASNDVTVAAWHDLDALERALSAGPPAAAVLMEPIPCNYGAVEPDAAYMNGVRYLCDRHGCLLVFDEVLTGFRLGLGGAQERIGVLPDLTVCSKAVASGFPIALVAGREDAMSPLIHGPVQAAGTFSGSPLSVAAAIATLDVLSSRNDQIYPRLEVLGAQLAAGIRAAAAGARAPLLVNQVGSVLQLFWEVDGPVRTFADAASDDRAEVANLARKLLDVGIHVPERGLMLLCAAHTSDDVEFAVNAFAQALE